MYDVIIIGGGPAGISAGLAALEKNKSVLLIEKNADFGKKLKITGGGRCNVTNNKMPEQLIKEVHNGRFLFSSLNTFNAQDIINLFKNNGLDLKEEDRGRMFPVTNKSKDIVETLKKALYSNKNFKAIFNESVTKLLLKDDVKIVVTNKGKYEAKSLIIATGGKSYLKTGSDGSGFTLAKNLGHTITPLYPTETALLSNSEVIKSKELQGITLQNVGIKTSTFKETGFDMIITHFGLSGPAILRSSENVFNELKNQKQVDLFIDILPKVNEKELVSQINKNLNQNPKKAVSNCLKLTQTRLMNYLFKMSGIKQDINCASVSRAQILSLVNNLKNFKVEIDGVRGLEYSFVTGGGVSLKEVNPKTMESKLVKKLFFAGEVLDLHAHTGGYNITVAFTTGHTAGKNS